MRSESFVALVAGSLGLLAFAFAARGDDASAEAPDAGVLDASTVDASPEADAGADSTSATSLPVVDASAPAVDASAPAVDAGVDEPANVGFAFGLRAGLAFPVGRVNGHPISDVISSSVPFTVDAGYFLTPHLYIGVFGSFAFVTSSSADTTTCPTGADCTARRWRAGATAAWHFRPGERVNPFVGLGVAYDLVNLTATDSVTGDVVESSALQGVELLDAQVGVEFRPRPFWGFGPYVNASTGVYGPSWNAHGWLGGGLRLFSIL